jgi:hypothetical protein
VTDLAPHPTAEPTTTSTLRGTAFAAIVLLLIEFAIGVNLFGQVPKADQGKGAFAAFAAVFANGPAALTIHATVGTLLVIAAVVTLVRAVPTRRVDMIVLNAIALLAIIGAWFSGAGYVGSHDSGAARGMAYATAVAILCYALVLLMAKPQHRQED